MTDDISKLTKHELALELQEVLSRSKDNALSWQAERETLTARTTSLEEAAFRALEKLEEAAGLVEKSAVNSMKIERISFEDRQALVVAENLKVDALNALVRMADKFNKERAKRKKEEQKRRELERQLKELTDVKQIQKDQEKPAEPNEDGVATAGNVLDAAGDSPTVGKD